MTGPIARRRPVHLDEVRWARAHTDRRLEVHDPRADDDRGHARRRALSRPAAAGVRVRAGHQRGGARDLVMAGLDVLQLDEPAFNVYMDDVAAWGIEALHRAIDGPGLHDGRAHLLRLRDQGQHRLEADARPRVAAVRADVPAAGARAASIRSRSSARTRRVPLSLLGLLAGKDVLVGCIDVATRRGRDAGRGGRDDPAARCSTCRPSGSTRARTAAWCRCPARSRAASCTRSAPALASCAPSSAAADEKGPAASLAPAAARSTYREYASRAARGRRLASGPF